MKKWIKRQTLSPEQYRRANLVMCMILAVSYAVYMIVEVMNINKFGLTLGLFIRCFLYAIMFITSIIIYKKMAHHKKCMIIYAVTFLITYAVLVFGNGVVVMVMIFPALAGFMIYLNSVVVGIGSIGAFIICIIKCITVLGNMDLFNYGMLIIAGFVVSIFGSYITICLLIDFSKEDRASIEKEALHRAEVAKTVESIVDKLELDFNEVVTILRDIDTSMSSADTAMNEIAGSSENTAEAVNNQAGMTSHIQERLENASRLSGNASETADKLKQVIDGGKNMADKLQEQSNIVDQNIRSISDTINHLVDNVQKVSGIIQAIENISSQTNLLALNASIEAARAGESGKGFAVVADEILKLAEETQLSTEQITAIILELNDVTKDTQDEIKESAECIAKQRRQVQEVNASFTETEHGMLQLKSDVDHMNTDITSVLSANREIVASISLLSAVSEEVSANTQTCKETLDFASDSLGLFSKKVNNTFDELHTLEQVAKG